MKETFVNLNQLFILSDGSSFKKPSIFKKSEFKNKDFKQVLLKSQKTSLLNNNSKLNEITYRKKLFI
jgi:hypothetical protein